MAMEEQMWMWARESAMVLAIEEQESMWVRAMALRWAMALTMEE